MEKKANNWVRISVVMVTAVLVTAALVTAVLTALCHQFISKENNTITPSKSIHDDFSDGYYVRAESEEELDKLLYNKSLNRSELLYDGSGSAFTAFSSMDETNILLKNKTTDDEIEEGDIVKTDGEYIYRGNKQNVYIVRTDKGEMDIESEIRIDNINQSVEEIFLHKEKLIVFTHGLVEGRCKVIMYTYDISDRENPQLVGELSVDGLSAFYRKVGDYIYIFTDFYETVDDNCIEALPRINNEIVDYDCIYIGEKNFVKKLCVAVDINNPNEPTDKIMIIDGQTNIFMGKDSIYVYKYIVQTMVSGVEQTYIAKFSYENGIFNANNSIKIEGKIENEYAISESEGNIRVFTTTYSSSTENRISNNMIILDENLDIIAEQKGIILGEETKTVRYIGDLVYVETNNQSEPLYVIDLSESSAPKIVNKSSISYVGDYLHLFDGNLLLGMGYGKNSENLSKELKISMIDITDTYNPKTLDSEIQNNFTSQATSNYKSVLIDRQKNNIGITVLTEVENMHYVLFYKVFGWNNNSFEELCCVNFDELTVDNEKLWDYEASVRALTIGDYLYLVTEDNAYSYYISNEFNNIDKLDLI